MASVKIEWPLQASPGRKPGERQGMLVNAYATQIGDEVRIRRTAGLDNYLTLDPQPSVGRPRGQYVVDDVLFHAWDNTLHAIKGDGTKVMVTGTILGSEPITMARNMRQPIPEIVVVTKEQGAQLVDLNDYSLKPYAGTSSFESVEYYSGYFFFTQRGGTVWASDLQNSPIDPGSFMRAEYAADVLWRTKSVGNALAVMSAESIEFWVDVAASPFPCQRQHAIDVGLLQQWAVAGGANEWENGLLWVAGDWTVRMLNGYEATIVSTDDVTKDIRDCDRDGHTMYAQVYVFNAQAIWSLTCRDWTWEFNISTGKWHKRESYRRPNWRAMFATHYKNKWIAQDNTRIVVEDWSPPTNLMEITPDAFDEWEERLRFMVESKPLKEFPVNFRIPSVDIDMTVGLGNITRPNPFETDPVVMVSWSHNGGATWSNPVARSLGAEGRYANKITVNNLGRTSHSGLILRLEVVDPVWISLTGAISTRARPSRPRAVNM